MIISRLMVIINYVKLCNDSQFLQQVSWSRGNWPPVTSLPYPLYSDGPEAYS